MWACVAMVCWCVLPQVDNDQELFMVYRKEGACPVPWQILKCILCQLSLRQSATLPPPSCPPLPPPCAGGEGEWEEIQIGPPPAAEGVPS